MARVRPSGLKTTESTAGGSLGADPSSDMPNGVPSWWGLVRSVTSHSRIPSDAAPPVARVRPSGLNATDATAPG